jgi:hypothetical protein
MRTIKTTRLPQKTSGRLPQSIAQRFGAFSHKPNIMGKLINYHYTYKDNFINIISNIEIYVKQCTSENGKNRKTAGKAGKISGKMKLATTIFVVAFDMQETKSSQ